MALPFFSVIVPTYNNAFAIKETIESVLRQTFPAFELLIMDDGSEDCTQNIVSGFKDERIIYEWAPNSGGPATPRNRGLARSTAPWVSFLDSDDIWYPNRLQEVYCHILSYPCTQVFCHDELLVNTNTGASKVLKYGPYSARFYKQLLSEGNCLSTSATTISASLLYATDASFNESSDYAIVEDYDLWLKLAYSQARFYFIPKVLGCYTIGCNNITHNTLKFRNNLRVVLLDHLFRLCSSSTSNHSFLRRSVVARLHMYDIRNYLLYHLSPNDFSLFVSLSYLVFNLIPVSFLFLSLLRRYVYQALRTTSNLSTF